MRKTLTALAALAALLLAACDAPSETTGTPGPTETREPTEPTEVTVQGRVTAWDAGQGTIVLDRMAMLSGEEAVAAAREDGALADGEDSLPNDFYIDDLPDTPARLRVAADADVRVFDCAAECALRRVPAGALLRGEVRPFNGDGALFEVRLSDGVVVALAEIYVP